MKKTLSIAAVALLLALTAVFMPASAQEPNQVWAFYMGFWIGGGWYAADQATSSDTSFADGTGLIGILVLVAAEALRLTGYERTAGRVGRREKRDVSGELVTVKDSGPPINPGPLA